MNNNKQIIKLPLSYEELQLAYTDYKKQTEILTEELARKTQECESLKQDVELLQNHFDTVTKECNDEIERLKQECEELKEHAQRQKNQIKKLRKNLALEIESTNRYCKTLEEIEKYCIEQNLKYDYTACEILDIINKAKGDN